MYFKCFFSIPGVMFNFVFTNPTNFDRQMPVSFYWQCDHLFFVSPLAFCICFVVVSCFFTCWSNSCPLWGVILFPSEISCFVRLNLIPPWSPVSADTNPTPPRRKRRVLNGFVRGVLHETLIFFRGLCDWISRRSNVTRLDVLYIHFQEGIVVEGINDEKKNLWGWISANWFRFHFFKRGHTVHILITLLINRSVNGSGLSVFLWEQHCSVCTTFFLVARPKNLHNNSQYLDKNGQLSEILVLVPPAQEATGCFEYFLKQSMPKTCKN